MARLFESLQPQGDYAPMEPPLAGLDRPPPSMGKEQERLNRGIRIEQLLLEADPFMQWDPSKETFMDRMLRTLSGGYLRPIPQPNYDVGPGMQPGETIAIPGQQMVDPMLGILSHRTIIRD